MGHCKSISAGGCEGRTKRGQLRLALEAWVAATGTLSAAERSYPTSEVRGRSWKDPMPEGWQPRGATPRPRSGAAAGSSYPTAEDRGGGREELPHVQGAVAAWAQKGLEELSHVEGQEGRW